MITERDFTYCPKCGATFEKKDTYLFCPSCKLEYYFNPKPTNAVILKNEQDEIMLVERSKNPKKGFWDLPGGFIDINETLEDSVHREVKEELGIQIKNLKYLTSYHDLYEFGEINYDVICMFFEATMINPEEIKPADDVASYTFFSPENLPYDRFAFKSMKKVLDSMRFPPSRE